VQQCRPAARHKRQQFFCLPSARPCNDFGSLLKRYVILFSCCRSVFCQGFHLSNQSAASWCAVACSSQCAHTEPAVGCGAAGSTCSTCRCVKMHKSIALRPLCRCLLRCCSVLFLSPGCDLAWYESGVKKRGLVCVSYRQEPASQMRRHCRQHRASAHSIKPAQTEPAVGCCAAGSTCSTCR
jgi:hypothetical protein